MKLQIIELSGTNIVEGTVDYSYIMELNKRFIVRTKPDTKMTINEAYKEIMRCLYNLYNHFHSFNLEDYPLLGIIPGLYMKVILEQEVSDHYLKDLKIQQRIKELEGDFQ